MKILVDTCVWSQVLRRNAPNTELTNKLKDLIKDGQVDIIGPIRQELLSGISETKHFKKLKEILSSFEDIPLESEYFIKAAEFSNICRSKGIQGSTIDFLICAVAYLQNLLIFTTDNDLIALGSYAAKRIFFVLYLIGILMVGSMIFQSIGKAVKSFVTAIARPVVFLIPLVLILPHFYGLDGIWLAYPITDILTFILILALIIPQVRELRSMHLSAKKSEAEVHPA